MANYGKASKFASKGIRAIVSGSKREKAMIKQLEKVKKAGPKQASGVGKNGKPLNQSAKDAQQQKLNRLHTERIASLEKNQKLANELKKEGIKTTAKRAGVTAGIVGYGAYNRSQRASLQKKINELETKSKNPTTQNTPQQTTPAPSTTTPEERKPETNNEERRSTSSGGSRSGGSSSGQPRVRVRPSTSSSSRGGSYTSRTNTQSSRRSSDVVKAKESGKTERYRIKQDAKTERTLIRAERSAKRQEEKTKRQTNRQTRRSNRKNRRD